MGAALQGRLSGLRKRLAMHLPASLARSPSGCKHKKVETHFNPPDLTPTLYRLRLTRATVYTIKLAPPKARDHCHHPPQFQLKFYSALAWHEVHMRT